MYFKDHLQVNMRATYSLYTLTVLYSLWTPLLLRARPFLQIWQSLI